MNLNKTTFTSLLMVVLLISCRVDTQKATINAPKEKLTKLDSLYSLSPDSLIDTYDLSDDSIIVFPDLSDYRIRKLDLSENLLDTIIVAFMPQGIEYLDVSYNRLDGYLEMRNLPSLKELNLSHNTLRNIDLDLYLQRLNVSYNRLEYTDFNHTMRYLDVSYNTGLKRIVPFEPTMIDTVISEGVADNQPLLGPISSGFGFPFE